MSKAYINQEYIKDQDSSVSFSSEIVDLACPLTALDYQVCWEETVIGTITWQASIFSDPYKWETLVNCQEVKLDIPGTTSNDQLHEIISIPNVWLTVGFIRFVWEPKNNGTGNIDVAIRVVPV